MRTALVAYNAYFADDMLYLAALLHDIGKPDCQVVGKREDDVNMHYLR